MSRDLAQPSPQPGGRPSASNLAAPRPSSKRTASGDHPAAPAGAVAPVETRGVSTLASPRPEDGRPGRADIGSEPPASVDALYRQLGGGAPLILRYGPITWRAQEGRAELHGLPLPLSRREFEVIGLLVQHAEQPLPKQCLRQALARRNPALSEATVEVYVSRLRRELAPGGVEIRTLSSLGYQLVQAGGEVRLDERP